MILQQIVQSTTKVVKSYDSSTVRLIETTNKLFGYGYVKARFKSLSPIYER